MGTSPNSAHVPVSSLECTAATQFPSRPPTPGQGARHVVDSRGFEAIAGLQVDLRPTTPGPPRLRSISELTYPEPPPTTKKPLSALALDALTFAPPLQTRITDTTLYPWRLNAELKISVPGSTDLFLGTGWFIGPYAVITAAHAVYPRQSGVYTGWASQIEVIPGMNGLDSPPPYGSFKSSLFYCPDGWAQQGGLQYDYGVILLNQAVGSDVGTFGYAVYADYDIQSAVANLAGYPVNAPDGSPAQFTEWYAAGNVAKVDDFFVYYNLGTMPGESGSCVYRNLGDQSFAMAVHTAGFDSGLNRGLRITPPIFNNLQTWASMQG